MALETGVQKYPLILALITPHSEVTRPLGTRLRAYSSQGVAALPPLILSYIELLYSSPTLRPQTNT